MDNNKKEVFKKILKYYFITRIVLLTFIIIVYGFIHKYSSIDLLFDNVYYLNIAKYGYINDYEYAFFPLVPILIRYLGKIGFIIFNQLLTIGSCYLIYKIDKEIFKNKDNINRVLLWLVSPISIFTMMFYTEGLFVFLTLLAYYLYKKKKDYLYLGIILGLSVLTRSLGSMLFFTIFIFMFINVIKKKEKITNILETFIPATIISCIYPVFLYFKKGNFFYFIESQKLWSKVSSNIFMVFIDSFKSVNSSNFQLCIFNYFLTLFLFIFIIYTIIKNRKEKKYYEIYTYMLLTLIAISFSIKNNHDPLASYYRYIFGCFSIYYLINKKYIYILLLMILTIFITIQFLVGNYFY